LEADGLPLNHSNKGKKSVEGDDVPVTDVEDTCREVGADVIVLMLSEDKSPNVDDARVPEKHSDRAEDAEEDARVLQMHLDKKESSEEVEVFLMHTRDEKENPEGDARVPRLSPMAEVIVRE